MLKSLRETEPSRNEQSSVKTQKTRPRLTVTFMKQFICIFKKWNRLLVLKMFAKSDIPLFFIFGMMT